MTILGTDGMTLVSTERGWRRDVGDTKVQTWQGPLSAAEAFYTSAKNDQTVDQADLSRANGLGTVVLTVVDQVDGIDTVNPELNDTWEIVAQDTTRPIEAHEHFANQDATAVQRMALVRRVVEGDAILSDVIPTGDPEVPYYNLLQRGSSEYVTSTFILRRTIKCSSRSQVKASWEDVDKAVVYPVSGTGGGQEIISQVSQLPGWRGTGVKHWLKRAPQSSKISRTRFQLTQDWWFAPAWSIYLYGGDGGAGSAYDMKEDETPYTP